MNSLTQLSGVLLLDKPAGMTSQRAVSAVKRLGADKAGHAGTLDPMATGLLPLLIGSATKLSAMLLEGDKSYVAKALLGTETDTLDITGEVVRQSAVDVAPERLEAAVMSFEGEIEQIPPMYSAISVGGRRMYNLARAGIEVDRPPRTVKIYEIKLLSFDGREAELFVSCSKGTYIRSLVDDIGKKLGCGACMSSLRRTAAAGFSVGDAYELEAVERLGIERCLIASERLFSSCASLAPPDFYLHLLQNGQCVDGGKLGARADRYRLYGGGRFVGVIERQGGCYRLVWRI